MIVAPSSPWRLLLTVAAVGLALVAQQLTFANSSSLSGWLLFACSAVLIVIAAPAKAPAAAPAPPVRARAAGRGPRAGRLGLWGAAALLAVTLATVLSSRNQFPVVALALWAAGCGLGAVGWRERRVSAAVRAPIPWSRREAKVLAALLLLALAARVLWIDTIPRYYFADEPRVGMFVRHAFSGGIPNFFTMGWNTWPMIGLSLQGVFGPVLGLRTSTLRLSSALFGTLAVCTTYLLARELFTRRTALFAALLLAMGRTAIDFSRLGVCHAQVTFFETLAFFWWWHGINTGKATSYWWAGVGLGLCLYTYNAGELVPVLWLGWMVLGAVVSPRVVRLHRRGALVTVAGFVVATYPWLFYVTDHFTFGVNWGQWTIMARNRQTISQAMAAWHAHGFGGAWDVVARQVWVTWLGFGVLPAGAYGLGYRGGGMLDHVSAPLFVLGLALAITRLRRWRGGFVAYWWAATVIAGGVLTIDPPAVVRLVGILPAVAILGALPLETLLVVGESVRAPAVIRLATGPAFAGALLLITGWINWRTYFVAFPRAPIDDTSELARQVERLPADTQAWLMGPEHPLHFTHDVNCEIFAFEHPERRLADVPDPAHFLPFHQPVDGPIVLVLGPSQATLAGYIETLYPHTEVQDAMFGSDRLLFRLLRMQPEDITRRAGLHRAEYDPGKGVTSTSIADPFSTGTPPTSSQRRVLWTGSVYWPTDMPVTLRIRAVVSRVDGGLAVRLADRVTQRFSEGGVADVAVTLPRGWQPIRIDAPGVLQEFSMTIQGGGVSRPFNRWDLRPEDAPEGLSAIYERKGATVARTVDPQLNAFAVEEFFHAPHAPTLVQMPFSATWQGGLHIVTPGTYEFEAQGSGPYSVMLDGQPLLGTTEVVPEEPSTTHASRFLEVGLHPVAAHWDSTRAAHTSRRLFQVFWTPPGGAQELIPPSSFVPRLGPPVP